MGPWKTKQQITRSIFCAVSKVRVEEIGSEHEGAAQLALAGPQDTVAWTCEGRCH